jgi:hypothetical protein
VYVIHRSYYITDNAFPISSLSSILDRILIRFIFCPPTLTRSRLDLPTTLSFAVLLMPCDHIRLSSLLHCPIRRHRSRSHFSLADVRFSRRRPPPSSQPCRLFCLFTNHCLLSISTSTCPNPFMYTIALVSTSRGPLLSISTSLPTPLLVPFSPANPPLHRSCIIVSITVALARVAPLHDLSLSTPSSNALTFLLMLALHFPSRFCYSCIILFVAVALACVPSPVIINHLFPPTMSSLPHFCSPCAVLAPSYSSLSPSLSPSLVSYNSPHFSFVAAMSLHPILVDVLRYRIVSRKRKRELPS